MTQRLVATMFTALIAASASVALAPTAQAALSPVLQTPFSQCRMALGDPNGVLFLGDSVTLQGFNDISAQFDAAGRPVCVNARVGRQTAEGLYQLSRYDSGGLLRPTTSVVMALGSCDLLRPAGDGNQHRAEDSATRPEAPRLLGARLQLLAVRQRATVEVVQGTRRIGEEIKWGVAHYGNLTAVQWPTLVKQSNYPSLLTRDLPHPTTAGNHARTKLTLTTMKPRITS